MRIKTDFWPKPIPLRHFDWKAWDDETGLDLGSPVGYGATEQQAVADLKEQLGGYTMTEEQTQKERAAFEAKFHLWWASLPQALSETMDKGAAEVAFTAGGVVMCQLLKELKVIA